MIEVEVHQQLRAFLREQGEPHWPHHLTMARLVARALRLQRHTLIQVGASSLFNGRYRISYMMPVLLWAGSAIVVAPEPIQQRLLRVDLPRMRPWMPIGKSIQVGDRWPDEEFEGVLLTTPQAWLSDRLFQQHRFPRGIPTILDGVDDLERWVQEELTTRLTTRHWEELMLACPRESDAIRDVRVQLTCSLFQHPPNPYDCYLLDTEERSLLLHLLGRLEVAGYGRPPCPLPSPWAALQQSLVNETSLIWVDLFRQQGHFALGHRPLELAPLLQSVWDQQPLVLLGGALEPDPEAVVFRQRLGLGDLTCLKFSPDRHSEAIQLYLPDRLPMPNTPQFQSALMRELRSMLTTDPAVAGLTVILVGDVPLKAQVGSVLAAEFGSRVQVERTGMNHRGILVTGWEFWRNHQSLLPCPHLLAIATLPLPSLENPLVAGQVAYHKRLHQDWFRLYLLPEALNDLQRAIAPVRESQGTVALLDNRVNHRSYGRQVLAVLSPMARIPYIESGLFNSLDCPVLE